MRTRLLYARYVFWFHIWRRSMVWPWLHRRTIRSVNQARHDYLDLRYTRGAR